MTASRGEGTAISSPRRSRPAPPDPPRIRIDAAVLLTMPALDLPPDVTLVIHDQSLGA